MKHVPIVAAVMFAALPVSSFAQDIHTKSAKAQYDMIKGNLTKTADKVGEDIYAFKPTPEVRSFGQLIGHVADGNYLICGGAATEKPKPVGAEKGPQTKAALQKALADSFAYCDQVIASLDDATGAAPVQLFGMPQSKLGVIFFNVSHLNEHYGNLVTYMRLKGIVPPSSEPRR
jgi:uncharacterized damage-inducible protein DinB